MESRIGQQFGNYRLLRLIGHGGFADVYLGEHIYMGTQAAIKVLHTQLGEREIERFRLEASMVARLEHPHIIRVLDFGVANTIPFLVMSYAPNGTLRERHPRGTVLPLPTVVRYARQVADALQYAHNERIIHRDVKPENMLLGKRNEILLSDFGIALISQNSQSQSPKDLAGTAAYMAPEQIDAHPRPASDQYALGIIVYEWLSGSCPFTGTFTEIALKHATVPPPPLSKKAPGISAALEEVILTALAKDPGKRFASIQAFAQALEQAAGPMTGTDSAEAPTMLLEERNKFGAPASGQPALTPPQQASSGLTPVIAEVPPTMVTPPRLGVSGQIPVTPNVPPAMHTPPNQPALFLVQPSPEGTNHDPTLRNSAERAGRPGSSAQAGQGVVTPFLGLESTPSAIDAPVRPAAAPAQIDVPPPLRTRRRWPFLVGLIILLLCIILVPIWVRYNGSKPSPSPTPTVNAHLPVAGQIGATAVAQATAAAPAYSNWVNSNGIMFGFDIAHTHWNRLERAISTGNITHLYQLWSYQAGDAIQGSVTVANGMVYAGSDDGKLYAFNANCHRNCQPLWSYTTSNFVRSSPAVANGLLYVGSDNGRLYAFDATCRSNCQPLWSYVTSGGIDSPPTVANGIVYAGSWNNRLYAFDATCRSACTPLWSYATAGGIYSSPAVAGGMVYVSSVDGKLYVFDAHCRNSCKPLWSYATGSSLYSSPAVAGGMVYVGSRDHKLYAFDASCRSDCKPLWSYTTKDMIYSSPAVAGGMVYIGSGDHNLYAFSANCRVSCKPLWSYKTNGPVYSSPTIANGVVYIGSGDHKLYAFSANCRTSCKPLWSYKTNGPVYSSPTIANGVVYIGTQNGTFYTFGLDG